MTEQEWLACEYPQKMLEFLEDKASERKIRLAAVACCRSLWQHLLTDDRSRNAIDVAEQFADGNVSEEELARAWEAAGDVRPSREWRCCPPASSLGACAHRCLVCS